MIELESPRVEEKPVQPDGSRNNPASPYDFAIFLARSLGHSLPFIVVAGLVTFGAFWGIHQMVSLEGQLNQAQMKESKAEIAETNAKASAKQAAQIEEIKSLQAYSERLNKLNTLSQSVSSSMEELVTKQIESMKRAGEVNDAQLSRAQAELSSLKTQIADEKKNRDSLESQVQQAKEQIQKEERRATHATALGFYEETIKNIQAAYMRSGSLPDDFLKTLQDKLDDDSIQNQVKSDMEDNNRSWAVRTVLAIQLFRKSSDSKYLDQAFELLKNNKSDANYTIASLFSRYGSFSDQQSNKLAPHIAGILLDESFPASFRIEILESGVLTKTSSLKFLSATDTKKLALYTGSRIVETSAKGDGTCYRVRTMLDLLDNLSLEAALVFATKASSNAHGYSPEDTQCIRTTLDTVIAGRTPSDQQIQQWQQ